MEKKMTKFPFEVPFSVIQENPDPFVAVVFSCLESEFLVLPRGVGFVDYPVFEQGYEALKQGTGGFINFSADRVLSIAFSVPISIVVLRTLLGFSPPEWAYVASRRTSTEISQGFIRSLDRKVRMNPLSPMKQSGVAGVRLKALIETACNLLVEGAPAVGSDKIHRLDKADTATGLKGVQALAKIGVPYAMLLYERFLGRPFAGHRDSVSDLVGDFLESAIEDVLTKVGISYQKTKRAEQIPGFDQAPDFVIPSGFNPQVIIEAKITEDDGTARDKVTRIQHLGELSKNEQSPKNPKFEVIACIGGRGFGVRREDMKKMLLATGGKVFTFKTLDRLIECSRLKEFKAH
jgi:hypothetical protein